MEYDKINNLLLSEDNESEKFSKFVRFFHLCYYLIYAIILMHIF